MTRYQYPNKAYQYGRLFITTGNQCAGAPVIDIGTTHSIAGWAAPCLVIRLRRTMGRALIIGWVTPRHLRPFKRLARMPIIGRLFRTRF